ncbi:hypothetical protein HKX48_006579 [Thoreauomyces humboldtii]|nr:hypothetical protein HKX48_006579 [Thoreauomyces humboldtii]
MTLEDFSSDEPRFLLGKSRAGYLTRLNLNNLSEWETVQPTGYAALRKMLFQGLLPFVDLYPWLIRHWLAIAERFLSEYLRIVQPWITVTFSQEVSRLLARGFAFWGSFQGAQTNVGDFLDMVGIPQLAHYDARWVTSEATPEGSYDAGFTVLVPHYHPGRDKYGDQHPTLRRVFLLTWEVTFVTLDVALTHLSTNNTAADTKSVKAICGEIVTMTMNRIRTTGLYGKLVQAKGDLKEHLESVYSGSGLKRSPLTAEAKKARRIRRALNKASSSSHIFAQGPPGSAVRKQQVDELYARQMLPLEAHMPYDGRAFVKQEWITWMMGRAQGISYITAITGYNAARAIGSTQNIFLNSLRIPPGASAAEIEKAVSDRMTAMRQGRASSAAFRTAQSTRMLRVWGNDPNVILDKAILPLEGQTVECNKRTVSFHALIQGTPTRIQFAYVQKISESAPTLSFQGDGIHLKDADGKDLGNIVPVMRMPVLKTHGANLLTVWRREYTSILGRAKRENYNILPMSETDAIWTFRKWLDDIYDKDRNKIIFHWQSTELPFNDFVVWLNENYSDHPHTATWRGIMTRRGRTENCQLRGSIMVLRGPFLFTGKKAKLVAVPGSGRPNRTATVWEFGPPVDDAAITAWSK